MDKIYLGRVNGVPFFKSNEVLQDVQVEHRTCTKMYGLCPNCRTMHNRVSDSSDFTLAPALHMRVIRRDRFNSDSDNQFEAFNLPIYIRFEDKSYSFSETISLSEHDASPSLFDTDDRYIYRISEFGYRGVFRCDRCGAVIITDPIMLGPSAEILSIRAIPAWKDTVFVTDQIIGYFINRRSIYAENPSNSCLEIVKNHQDMDLVSIFRPRISGIQRVSGIRPIVNVSCTDSRTPADEHVYRNDLFQIKNNGERVHMEELTHFHRIHCEYTMDQIRYGTFNSYELDPLFGIIRDYGLGKIKVLTAKDHWR